MISTCNERCLCVTAYELSSECWARDRRENKQTSTRLLRGKYSLLTIFFSNDSSEADDPHRNGFWPRFDFVFGTVPKYHFDVIICIIRLVL